MSGARVVALLVLALAGCGGERLPQPQPKPWDFLRQPDQLPYRTGPDEFGVTCYRWLGSSDIACVQVMPPRAAPRMSGVFFDHAERRAACFSGTAVCEVCLCAVCAVPNTRGFR